MKVGLAERNTPPVSTAANAGKCMYVYVCDDGGDDDYKDQSSPVKTASSKKFT